MVKLKSFLKKYKRQIIYWTVFPLVLWYFLFIEPKYYLNEDIESFKSSKLIPFLIWTAVVFVTCLVIYWIIKRNSIKDTIVGLFVVSASLGFGIFIFQSFFLGVALFLNRQVHTGKIAKEYVVSYMGGVEKSKNTFILHDSHTKKIISDNKLENKVYNDSLQDFDLVSIRMYMGILGIPFSEKKLDDGR